MDMLNSAGPGGGGAINYADSVDSSPRSRGGESWDEPFPSSASSKLRLMCSYGGRIVPRPTDRSLCYLGGDTRIVVVERHTTLADLSTKLSRNLLGGLGFTLKYQLPNEDLDSLISVTTDEDLDNMIDEYDRIVATYSAGSGSSSSRSSRLRLFLFPSKPESAPSSIGSLLDDSKSENWFVDALNGAIGMDGLPGDLSGDSSSVNCLLGLDDESLKSRSGISASGGASVGTGQSEHDQRFPRPDSSGKLTRPDTHSMPDSPMVETTSSFGSTSSAPYLSNLPPIRLRPEDRTQEQRIGGLEDHFSQMNITSAAAMAAASAPGQKFSDEGGFREPNYTYHHPPLTNPSSISPSENPSRKNFSSDEDKPEQVPINKQQQQQQPLPPPPQPEPQAPILQQKPNPMDPTPLDPIARPVYYPDRVSSNNTGINPISDTKRDVPISSYVITSMPPAEQQFRQHPSHIHHFHQQQQQPHQFQQQQQQQQPQPQQFHPPQQQQQQQPQQFQQQQQQQPPPQQFHQPQQQPQPPPPPPPQFIQANPNPQYLHHPATSTVVPYPAYYQMPIQQSQQSNPYDPQQFPVYYLPVRQNPQPPQPGASTTFSKSIPAKPDLQPNLYRMAAMPPPQPNNASTLPTAVSQPQLQPLIHLASDQSHPYTGMGYHVMHHPHPSQQQPAAPVAANYGYEFATDPSGPVFFTQTTTAPGLAPPQYQSVVTSPDAAAAAPPTHQSGEVKQTRAA